MLLNKIYNVIDFGTSKISIASGKLNGNEVNFYGLGVCEYAGFRDGEWLAPQDLEESIMLAKLDAESQTGRKIHSAYVAIPGEFSRTFFTHVESKPINLDGRIVESDIENLMKQGEASLPWPDDYEVMHRTPVLYRLDGQSWRRDPTGQFARDLEAYISYTAVDTVFMKDMELLLDDMGIGAVGFISTPKTTTETIASESDRQTIIVIDSGYYTTDIMVYENGGLIVHDNIPLGGYHITADLMVKFNQYREIAEKIKRNCSIGMDSVGLDKIMVNEDKEKITFSVNDAQVIIEGRIMEILTSTLQAIQKTGMDVDNRVGVYLTGGGIAMIKGVREFMSRNLGVTVRTYRPKRPIQANSTMTSVCSGLEYIARHRGRVQQNTNTNKRLNLKGLFR